nr:MAG TPA: protein of unknown function (DUF4969) [Crassvirales sp.]
MLLENGMMNKLIQTYTLCAIIALIVLFCG